MSRKRVNRKRVNRYAETEELNPMNYVSNLSDVMLILAVGIMLALIIHWNVKIKSPEPSEQVNKTEDTIEFDENDLEGKEIVPENLNKMGEVYYDPDSGKYYIIKNGDDQE